jgi:hypothetical protein
MSTADKVEFCRGMLWGIWQDQNAVENYLNYEQTLDGENKIEKTLDLLTLAGLIKIKQTVNGFHVSLTSHGLEMAQWIR